MQDTPHKGMTDVDAKTEYIRSHSEWTAEQWNGRLNPNMTIKCHDAARLNPVVECTSNGKARQAVENQGAFTRARTHTDYMITNQVHKCAAAVGQYLTNTLCYT